MAEAEKFLERMERASLSSTQCPASPPRLSGNQGRLVVSLGLVLPAGHLAAASGSLVDHKADHRRHCSRRLHPRSLFRALLVARCRRICHGCLRQHSGPSHRLPRLPAGRQVHPSRQHSGDEARGELDLIAYEDPVFYDRLERARVQATDRLGMIQSIGRLVQQVITAASLSVSILLFSPWLLLLLIVGILPAFLGESHFAFLGYAKNFRQTPIRRELDYLRVLGAAGKRPRNSSCLA